MSVSTPRNTEVRVEGRAEARKSESTRKADSARKVDTPKAKVDPRFLTENDWTILDGNELLMKGALESEGGIHLLSGYPGSPVATFFDTITSLSPLLKEMGVYGAQANNEAISAAMLNGSQMQGLRGMIAMKSVGVQVASDALALGNLVGAHPQGGAIVVLGDDPWSESTQVPADSRYLCEHLRMPVIEPADAQELKDWIDLVFKISRRSGFFMGYMVTPLLADGGGTVWCKHNQYPLTNTRFKAEIDTASLKLEDTVLLPPRTGRKEEQLAARVEKLHASARELGIDRIEEAGAEALPGDVEAAWEKIGARGWGLGAGPRTAADGGGDATPVAARYGFVACGQAYQFLRQALTELGLWGQFPVLKLGLTYPIDPLPIAQLASVAQEVVVVEERRGLVESQIASLLMAQQQLGRATPRLWGKRFPGNRPGFPDTRGLSVGICVEKLLELGASGWGPGASSGNGSVDHSEQLSRSGGLAGGDDARQDDRIVGFGASAEQSLLPVRTAAPVGSVDSVEHGQGARPDIDSRLSAIPRDSRGVTARMADAGAAHRGTAAHLSNHGNTNPGSDSASRPLGPELSSNASGSMDPSRPLRLQDGQLPRPILALNILNEVKSVPANLPARTPTFCPGCPHRDSSSVFLEIKKQFADAEFMRKRFGKAQKPIDLLFHGDTGCYTMLMFAPNEPLMHNYSGMGLGGATGAGIDPFIKNKQVVFMGDGTFFHSGMVAISNAVKCGQDITFVILDNRTTAMTGHQSHPGTDRDVMDDDTFQQDIEKVVQGLGQLPFAHNGMHLKLVRLNPEHRGRYKALLEETILAPGVKVVIADKECGITYHRRQRREERNEIKKRGYLPRKTYMNVTEEVCEFCQECTKQTGCPALTIVPTDHGPKMQTDLTTCVNDGACARIDACPSFEQVTVLRKRPPVARGKEIKLENLPEPAWVHRPFGEVKCGGDGLSSDAEQVWRCWLSGVGGMGIGLSSAILVRAGYHAGYHVRFADKKGLAIRNGGVFSAVTFVPRSASADPARQDSFVSANIPFGKADVILGLDPLEAARAVDPAMPYKVASRDRTSVVLNRDKTFTVHGLIGREAGDFEVDELETLLRKVSRPGALFAHQISEQCERLFGTKLYANIVILGVAYQLGLLPLTAKQLERAIHDTVPSDQKNNLRAFNLGRKLVAHPEQFGQATGEKGRRKKQRSLAQLVREKSTYLSLNRFFGVERTLRALGGMKAVVRDSATARAYKTLVFTTLRACREMDRQTKYDLAVRIYDLICFDGVDLARDYCEQVRLVFNADDPREGYAITRSVVWNLAKLMIIKDEVYVAHLLTSFEKLRRDRQRYNVNTQAGDRVRYTRVFHPRYFGVKVTIPTPDWVLHVMRNMKFVRKLFPTWHKSDKQLLAWYRGVLERFYGQPPTTSADYQRWSAALASLDAVNGYREYREPKMAEAKRRCEQVLAGQATPVKTKPGLAAAMR